MCVCVCVCGGGGGGVCMKKGRKKTFGSSKAEVKITLPAVHSELHVGLVSN